MGVSFTDADHGIVVGEGSTILRTTNGGEDWVSYTSGISDWLQDVTFIDSKNGTIIGLFGTILRTTDGGINWTPQTAGTYNGFTGVSFAATCIGTIVGANGLILRTTNGGENWILQTSGIFAPLYDVSLIDSLRGIVVGDSGIVLRTTNGGANWVHQTSGTMNRLYDVSFTDDYNGTVTGLNGTILKTINGGVTWVQQTSGTTNLLPGVSFTDANNGTTVGLSGTILRTTNGGINWIHQTSGTTNNLTSVSFIDANIGTAVGWNGTILRTIIGGGLAPFPPTNLTAKVDTLKVLLTWQDNFNNEDGFVVQKKNGDTTSSKSFFSIDTLGANVITYTDTNFMIDTIYSYRVNAFNIYGLSGYSNIVTITVPQPVGVMENEKFPIQFTLNQNYPNPFNPTTTIKYAIPQQSFVNIAIYNLLGEKILTLINEEKQPGNYEVLFDGSNLSSGVYFYKIVSSNFIETKKLILMK